MQYHRLKASLKSITQVNKITVTTKLSTPVIPNYIDIVLKCTKKTKDMFNIMTENKENIAGQICRLNEIRFIIFKKKIGKPSTKCLFMSQNMQKFNGFSLE